MAFDAFLQLWDGKGEKVPGESSDKAFGQANSDCPAIELSEFSFGAENTVSIGSASGGAGAGKAKFNEFSVKKLTDRASVNLFLNLCVGQHYSARLSIRKSGGAAGTKQSGAVYLVFEFVELFVSGLEWSGSSGDDTPTESVKFFYGELHVLYKKQKPDGTLVSPPEEQYWSQLTNSDTPSDTAPQPKGNSFPS